jgi:hypothetical protein
MDPTLVQYLLTFCSPLATSVHIREGEGREREEETREVDAA